MDNQFQSSYLKAAHIILQQAKKPQSARDLANSAIRDSLLPDNTNAKTPWKTMHARLSVYIRKHGDNSVFMRVAPGMYDIRKGLDFYEAPPRKPPKANEQVLVFPTSVLDDIGRFQGVKRDWQPIFSQLINPSHCRYIDRVQAEQDSNYKQIIAYILVTSGNKILAYKRGNYNRVADFLRGCQCIGFGGHVSYKDFSVFDVEDMGIVNCAARELGEEIRLPPLDANSLGNLEGINILGIINDDSSENGRKHFAVVLGYEVKNTNDWDNIKRKELSINQLRWLDLDSHSFSLWDFEYWSQLCLREYFPQHLDIQPSYKLIRKSQLRPPHLLCVTGQLGSGKSKATEILTRDFGYCEINSGKTLARLLNIPPVEERTRPAFQAEAWNFISSPNGPKLLASAIWDEVCKLGKDRVLIDGIRQRATLEALKLLAGSQKVGMLFVHTPPDVAYQFYKERVQCVNNIHDFLNLREAPVESEVADMISLADALLYNWQGKDVYQDAICKLMTQVQK